MNKWVLEQIKPGTLLEVKMTKLKLSSFRHIMRRLGSLDKTIVLGKEDSQERKEEEQT